MKPGALRPNGTSATTTVDSSQNFEAALVANGAGPAHARAEPRLYRSRSQRWRCAYANGLRARGSLGIGYWHQWFGVEVGGFAGGAWPTSNNATALASAPVTIRGILNTARRHGSGGWEPGIVLGLGGTCQCPQQIWVMAMTTLPATAFQLGHF